MEQKVNKMYDAVEGLHPTQIKFNGNKPRRYTNNTAFYLLHAKSRSSSCWWIDCITSVLLLSQLYIEPDLVVAFPAVLVALHSCHRSESWIFMSFCLYFRFFISVRDLFSSKQSVLNANAFYTLLGRIVSLHLSKMVESKMLKFTQRNTATV